MARRKGGSSREYPRSARLSELIREIVAEELGRHELEGVAMLTITGVDVDNELTLAKVYFSCFDDDDVAVAALLDIRPRLKAAIGRQTRLRRTPQLVFHPDTGVRHGSRVEEILRDLYPESDQDVASVADVERRDAPASADQIDD